MNYFLESCCTSAAEVAAAIERGAQRIELCVDLSCGGVTPPRDLLKEAVRVAGAMSVPVNVLVRPRGGDFHFSDDEVREMEDSIAMCGENGASGVVIGALDESGRLDVTVMRRLMSVARQYGLSVTFHRAFDVCADPLELFESIMELGCDRLLTSGHEADAYQGRFLIGELVRRAQGRIVVMAGCGVRPDNIEAIERDSAAPEFHASAAFFRSSVK